MSETVHENGGGAVAEMFRLHEVGPIFGMGGFQLLPFYDGVRTRGLVHHLIEDERSGAFAADAYARVTGRPGVVDATLGPGATNLVTALTESLNAGVPVVALVGGPHRSFAGRNMTQETDQLAVLRPAAKLVIRVEDGLRIPELVRRAFAVATSGRQGPVVLELPEDVSHQFYDFPADDFWALPSGGGPRRRARPDRDSVQRAADLLSRAERPVILAGGGVHLSMAHAELQALAESHDVPVAHTLSGKGAIADVHPLSIGVFGRYTRYANDVIKSSDCIIAVGCKLGEIATRRYDLLTRGVLVHIDVDADELERWAPTSVAMWADAKLALADLVEAAGRRQRGGYRAELDDAKERWLAETAGVRESDESPINVGRVFTELNRTLGEDAILVADGGFASHWGGLLFDTKRAGRSFVSDRGFASIGYGLPGGIGCALASAELGTGDRVVAVTGDGGFNMSIGALETARRVGVGVVVVVLNNAASGYVKALQHATYGAGNYQSSDLTRLDFAAIAEAYGCVGIRVTTPDELAAAVAKGMAVTDRPTVIDVSVTTDPAKMLPGVDNRTVRIKEGDRIA